MKNNPIIWVLTDDIIGNSNQAIGLASKISDQCKIKKIKYNCFAKLPNMVLKLFPLHINKSVLNDLKNTDSVPDVIICAGRRLAVLAVHLKHVFKNQKHTKLIQIMKPDLDPREFEMVILPQHDNFNYVLPNIVRTIGSLNNIQDRIQQNKPDFIEHYPMRKKFVSVLIGGSNKKYKFKLKEAEKFVHILQNVCKQNSLKLLITFSRRTPLKVQKYIRENISSPHIIYSPEDKTPSPYPGSLSCSDYVIVTSDSVSMCSEAVSCGVPTYIYSFSDFTSIKHNYFIQQLMDIGVARRLEDNTSLEAYSYKPLRELDRVGKIVKNKIFN